MELFKKTWKAKGSLIHRCQVISGTIWIIKTALNMIIKAIIAAIFNVGVIGIEAFCTATIDYGSYGFWGAQMALEYQYIKYRDEGNKEKAGM